MVKILKTKNVSILKDLIKEKKVYCLNHVDASELNLTQVSLPVDDDLEESLKKVDLASLKPTLLSQVFPRGERIVGTSSFKHLTKVSLFRLFSVLQRPRCCCWVPRT